MYDIDISTFKIMLQAIREMLDIEYGCINIYYNKEQNQIHTNRIKIEAFTNISVGAFLK